MHQKKICDIASDTTITLHKDVVHIIGKYAKPVLWMYWIKNIRVPTDKFIWSKFIEADNKKDAMLIIFEKHCRHFFKERYLTLPIDVIYHLKTISFVTNRKCVRCNNISFDEGRMLCYEHYPPTDTLLRVFDDLGVRDEWKIHMVQQLLVKMALDIKKVEW